MGAGYLRGHCNVVRASQAESSVVRVEVMGKMFTPCKGLC